MGLIDFSQFVDELATMSGRAILPFFRSAFSTDDKAPGGVFDPVTEADRAGEVAMRHLIKRSFPTHGIVGEEFGAERQDAEYVWVLDPIDGTRAFMAGLPVWGTLIGLTRLGTPAYGLMHQPFTGERFSGDGGKAVFRRAGDPGGERRLKTRRCTSLADAIVSTTSPRLFAGEALRAYDRVESAAQLARYGAGCYADCMRAAGGLRGALDAVVGPQRLAG